jgi:hypothetical protein
MSSLTQQFPYTYEVVVELDEGGDAAALGGAVTVELCGHWQHEPPCRWPHHTEAVPLGPQTIVRVEYSCEPSEEPDVRRRIDAVLAVGSLTGPEGHTTTWTVVGRD